MLVTLIALQALALVALIILLLRRSAPAHEAADPRLAQFLTADLPTQITRLDARFDSLDTHLRVQLAEQRSEAEGRSSALRSELITNLTTLSSTLTTALDKARQENETAAERLRSRVQEGLQQLSTSNEKKLEEMRLTVDEKLQKTLHARISESFGQVHDQLASVHKGLGEMTRLSADVTDLSRIFTNVKSRGGFAEVQLGKLLEQVLAPGQYVVNARVKPGSLESVEYAVKFPGVDGDVLLPIDAKFPREDWERLESAYEHPDAAQLEAARRNFDAAIRTEGKRICSKYINEPVTTPYAIMFLPTESLYAEVLRRDGLQAELHLNCRVMVAGPSNLYALLTSFQLGFRMLNLQKKGNEVWKVLASAQTEFGKFGDMMDKMDKQVGTVQNTIRDLGTRTRAINRTLRDVSAGADQPVLPTGSTAAFDGLLPMLAASDDE